MQKPASLAKKGYWKFMEKYFKKSLRQSGRELGIS